jgi:hypothetical protein
MLTETPFTINEVGLARIPPAAVGAGPLLPPGAKRGTVVLPLMM